MALEPKAEAKRLVNLFKPKFKDLYLDEYIIPKSKECALELIHDEKELLRRMGTRSAQNEFDRLEEVRNEIVKIK